MEPTIVINVKPDDPLMEDEIFGPILPILTVNSPDEAIQYILSKPKPLALYVFSRDNKTVNKMLSSISSGGSCVNDVVWQNPWRGLPFGGVGASGMGNYHGKFTFDTFSHKRGVLVRGMGYLSEKLGEARYPPINSIKLWFITFILHHFNSFDVKCSVKGAFTHFLALVMGAIILFLVLDFGFNAIDFNNLPIAQL
jgi:aldehyde dehydrogenase (NAD+)